MCHILIGCKFLALFGFLESPCKRPFRLNKYATLMVGEIKLVRLSISSIIFQ